MVSLQEQPLMRLGLLLSMDFYQRWDCSLDCPKAFSIAVLSLGLVVVASAAVYILPDDF